MATGEYQPTSPVRSQMGTRRALAATFLGTLPGVYESTKSLLSPEQEATLNELLAQFTEQGLTTGGADPFSGDLVAGLSDLEGLSLEALEQKVLNQVQGTGVGAEAGTALSKVLRTGGAPVDFEDYYRTSVRDPLMQEFSELVLPELTRRFGSSGAFGSDRKLAEQQATERLTKTLAGARGELAFKTHSDAANRLLQAIGLTSGVESAGVDDLMKLIQGASLPRTIQQARLTSEYGEFQRQEQQKQKRIEQVLAALGIKTRENTAIGVPGSPGLIGGILGAAGKGGSFFSDRRLKSDIILIGPLPSGLNLYSFRYKHDPVKVYFGVMADEVEEIFPSAVIMRDDGMKLVDYTMLSEFGLLQ